MRNTIICQMNIKHFKIFANDRFYRIFQSSCEKYDKQVAHARRLDQYFLFEVINLHDIRFLDPAPTHPTLDNPGLLGGTIEKPRLDNSCLVCCDKYMPV